MTLEQFAEWYESENYTIKPPFEAMIQIPEENNVYSYTIFKKDNYIVNLHIVDHGSAIPNTDNKRILKQLTPYDETNSGVAILSIEELAHVE